jgi:signal transduction histidine kinase
MPRLLTFDRSAREATWLTLGLWGVTFPLFLLPTWLERGEVAAWIVGVLGACVLVGLAFSPLLYLLVRWSERLRLPPRALAVVTGAVVVAWLVSQADAYMLAWGRARFRPEGPQMNLLAATANNFLIYVWIYGLYTLALVQMRLGAKMRDRERQLAEAQAAAHQAQLAALRFQLNPHFLFNTLNAISTLIVTGRNGEAELMLQKLSDFLRTSLSSDPEGVITLQDELATVEAYLDIESVRFGDRLAVETTAPEALMDAVVPSFLMQPIVENAVKYAVAPARRTVTIRIEASADGEDLVLMVEDDGDGHDTVATRSGTGVGLQNVRRRLQALYGDRGVLEAAPRARGFLAIVRLPLQHAAALAKAA